GNRPVPDVLALFLANTRVPAEREGDLLAQWAALRVGAVRMCELAVAHGVHRLAAGMDGLQRYSERLMRAAPGRPPIGTSRAVGLLDGDGCGATRLRIAVAITRRGGRARVDFSGTAAQTAGPVNANIAVTRSAVLYVFTALAGQEIPPNDGLARPLTIV